MRMTFIVLLFSNVLSAQVPPASVTAAATRVGPATVEHLDAQKAAAELVAAAAVAEPMAAGSASTAAPVVVASSARRAPWRDAREPIAMLLIGGMLIGLGAAVRKAV